MKTSMRLSLLTVALALVAGSAQASHSEVDTYLAPSPTTVVHVSGSCGGPEHTGGGCFLQFEEGDEVTITVDDAVVSQTGMLIGFRNGAGTDISRIGLCANDGVANGPYTVPTGTARIVVFLGAVINTQNNALVCPGAPQPTTGTVTATYLS